jgi:uncharacterized protein
MLLRLLIWFALMAAVGWWIRRALSPRRPNVQASEKAARRQRTLAKPEEMIDCARCGLHLPASEALRDRRRPAVLLRRSPQRRPARARVSR